MILYEWQKKLLDWLDKHPKERTFFSSGRQSGKTVIQAEIMKRRLEEIEKKGE